MTTRLINAIWKNSAAFDFQSAQKPAKNAKYCFWLAWNNAAMHMLKLLHCLCSSEVFSHHRKGIAPSYIFVHVLLLIHVCSAFLLLQNLV